MRILKLLSSRRRKLEGVINSEKMSENPVSVLVVAVGGYGYYYLKTLWEEFPPEKVEVVGIVDPRAEHSGHFPEIKRRSILVFNQIEDFYQNGHAADLTVISAPIQFHVPQSCVALQNNSNVLLDKPMASSVEDADRLIQARDASGKWVMIGFQFCYSEALQALKKDILKGMFGKPIRLKTIRLWQRDDAYYQRNNWAGKIKDSQDNWILDSPASNALAHELQNMLYLTGKSLDRSVQLKEVTAETYRAHDIENYDTIACRIIAEPDVELLFYGSHSTFENFGPVFRFEFEDAVISYGESSNEIIVLDRKGNQKNYGSPFDDHQFRKLFEAVDAVNNPRQIVCGPEAARSHTVCIAGIQESIQSIHNFPDSMIEKNRKEKRSWVTGLDDTLIKCYNDNMLPSETGCAWAIPGKTVSLNG